MKRKASTEKLFKLFKELTPFEEMRPRRSFIQVWNRNTHIREIIIWLKCNMTQWRGGIQGRESSEREVEWWKHQRFYRFQANRPNRSKYALGQIFNTITWSSAILTIICFWPTIQPHYGPFWPLWCPRISKWPKKCRFSPISVIYLLVLLIDKVRLFQVKD